MINEKIDVIFVMVNDGITEINNKSKIVNDVSSHIQLSKVISDVDKTIKRFKKYGKPNWYVRWTTNSSTINANLILCEYEFKSFLRKGSELRNRIKGDIEEMTLMIENCNDILLKFNDAQNQLQEMIDQGLDEHGRIARKLNDVMSAVVLVNNTIAQMKLTMNNVYLIHDKFDSVDNILRPILEKNLALSKMNRIELINHL